MMVRLELWLVALLAPGGTFAADNCSPAPSAELTPTQQVLATFDTDGGWSGGSLDTSLKREGAGSRSWDVSRDSSLRLTQTFDLSQFDCLRLWVHSNQASPRHTFLIYLRSENGSNQAGSYYSYLVYVDWSGWRQLEIPFFDFHSTRSPIGYSHIDSIRFWADGWAQTPDPNVVLHLDTLSVHGYEYPPASDDPEVTEFDWRSGSIHGSHWHTFLQDDHVDQQYPSTLDVVTEPLYLPDTASLRFRVHAGEDIRAVNPDAHNPTNIRAEHHSNRGAYPAQIGDTVWWRFTYLWETLDLGRPMTIFQWRNQAPGVLGGPGVELAFQPRGGRLQIVGRGWAVDPSGEGVLVDDVESDRWYDFICKIKYHAEEGEAQCWVDGVMKWDYAGPTVQNLPDHDFPHIRNGLYRWRVDDDYPIPAEYQETIAYQGPTAYAVNVSDGLQKMLGAFPMQVFSDDFESGNTTAWSAPAR